MKYKHYETPMDWLKEKRKPYAIFLVYKKERPAATAIFVLVAFCGEVSFGNDSEDGHWDQFIDWHWRPFADIEALDS